MWLTLLILIVGARLDSSFRDSKHYIELKSINKCGVLHLIEGLEKISLKLDSYADILGKESISLTKQAIMFGEKLQHQISKEFAFNRAYDDVSCDDLHKHISYEKKRLTPQEIFNASLQNIDEHKTMQEIINRGDSGQT